MKRLSLVQWVALAAGMGWLTIQTGLMLEHATGTLWQLASVPAAAVTLALIPVFMEVCWARKARLMTVPLGLMMILLLAYTLPAATERASEKLDGAVAHDRIVQLASKEADAECRSGNGPKCRDLRAKRDGLMKAGTNTLDHYQRLATVLHLDAALVQTYLPLALPLANELGVWVLIWMGLSPSLMVKRKRKR